MSKKRASASESNAEIARRIARGPEAACRACTVTPIKGIGPREATFVGVNWRAGFIRGPSQCAGVIEEIVVEVSREYDCSDW